MNEIEYKKQIDELQETVAEYEQLLQQALDKINELNLRITLRDSVKSKRKEMKEVIEYEQRVAELNEVVELISTDELLNREQAAAHFIKSIAYIRKQIADIAKSKHCRHSTIDQLDLEISDLSETMSQELARTLRVYNSLCEFHREDIDKDTIKDFLNLITELLNIVKSRKKRIMTLEKDVTRLNRAIMDFSGGDTIEDLRKQLKSKDALIAGYKQKIQSLEFELSKVK